MESTPPRRRWFQFSMATLLWFMLVASLISGFVRERMRLQAEIRKLKQHNAALQNIEAAKTLELAEANKRRQKAEAGLSGATARLQRIMNDRNAIP